MEAYECFRTAIAPSFDGEPELAVKYGRWVADLKSGIVDLNDVFLDVYAKSLVRLDSPYDMYDAPWRSLSKSPVRAIRQWVSGGWRQRRWCWLAILRRLDGTFRSQSRDLRTGVGQTQT